jgi:hypothetical protein
VVRTGRKEDRLAARTGHAGEGRQAAERIAGSDPVAGLMADHIAAFQMELRQEKRSAVEVVVPKEDHMNAVVVVEDKTSWCAAQWVTELAAARSCHRFLSLRST